MSVQQGTQTTVRRPDGAGTEVVAVFGNATESGSVPPNPLRRASRRNTRGAPAAAVAVTQQRLARAVAEAVTREPQAVVEEGEASDA